MRKSWVRKGLVYGIILLFVGSAILPTVAISSDTARNDSNLLKQEISTNIHQKYFTNTEENHTIENPRVPYVGQTTAFYCAYACLTMLIQYFGFNTSLYEVLHHSGLGYSLFYSHYFSVFTPARVPCGGVGICQNPFNVRDLANLYNLSFISFTSSPLFSDEAKWEAYWEKVKQNIRSDIPVLTSVDLYTLPYLRDKFNITDNQTHGGHAIVLVGFNETNATVCYNDPSAALWNDAVNGTYVYVPKEIIRNAVKNTTGTKYLIWAFKKDSDSPLMPPEVRFEKAHARNIERVKGYLGAYVGLELQIPIPLLGINSIKALKKDLRIGITHQMITILQYREYKYGYYDFQMISTEKHNVSQYLFENENLSEICNHDALLLQQESNDWKNLSLLVLKINEIGRNNSFFKTLLLSRPIIEDMNNMLNNIIDIENAIIIGEQASDYTIIPMINNVPCAS